MEATLYVGNISYSTTEEDLRELFAEAGNVKSAKIIMDRETGRSKGFAFVEMASSDEAQDAIAQFNGREAMGRKLIVNVARPREDRRPRGGDRGDRGNRW